MSIKRQKMADNTHNSEVRSNLNYDPRYERRPYGYVSRYICLL